jgi:ABC-type sugar transport system ATPase subunit
MALDDVSFEVHRGEVHALIGENGAGKSTMVKIISGAIQKDEGTIRVNGEDSTIRSPHDARQLGISAIHQELCYVPHMTVAENIFLGREPSAVWPPGFVSFKTMVSDAQVLLNSLNINMESQWTVAGLSAVMKQLVVIARALSLNAEIYVMDEPTAALSDSEVSHLFEVIEQLKEKGYSIIYVSHRLEEILKIADRVTVLKDGRKMATKAVKDTCVSELVELMIGEDLGSYFPRRQESVAGNAMLEVENLYRAGELRDINFTIHKGEILGLTGLAGAGMIEVARCIFGRDPKDNGTIRVDGKRVVIKNPIDAIRQGIVLLPEERAEQGLFLELSVGHNILMASLDQVLGTFPLISKRAERSICSTFVDRVRIKTPTIEQPVKFLSGGNQQKVVLAKWLLRKGKVFLFCEPTRGIDVGAKVEIYRFINELAEAGAGVLVVSSEVPEVFGMCDRFLVMRKGSIVDGFTRQNASEHAIHIAAAG